jgi:hypothetical protein
MATVTKDFRIKSGLVVEGANGTIDGSDIITEDIITGGTQTNIAVTYNPTTKTLDFVAENGVADSTTSDLAEGTRLYYTNERVDDRVANLVEGGTGIAVSYDDNGNVLGISADFTEFSTTDITEGDKLFFTDERAIAAVGGSATSENTPNTVVKRDGNGAFAAGNITTDGTLNVDNVGSLSEANGFVIANLNNSEMYIRGTNNVSISSDGNLTLSSVGDVYKGSAGSGNQLVTQNNVDAYIGDATVDGSTGNTITDRIDSVAGDLSDHISDTSTHGVAGDIVGTSDFQVLTNKTVNDELYFTNPSTTPNDGGIKINDATEDFEIKAYVANLHLQGQEDVTVNAVNGDIVLSADGATYINSVSAGNQVATNAYVDNAVSGLAWKEAVNLLATSNVPLSGDTETVVIDGHSALDSTDTYRLLLVDQTDPTENGIYVYADNGTTYTLTRADDADTIAELVGAAVFVMEGTQYGSTSWVQGNHYANSFDDLSWTQFSGGGTMVAGTGISVDGLEISVDRTTVDTWYEADGTVSTHSALTTGIHGVTGNVVGTSDTQTLTNKTVSDSLHFQDGTNNYSAIYANADDLKIDGSDDIVLTTNNGDIILNADGSSYIGVATPQNEIATKGYVDNQTTTDIAEGTNLYFTDARAVTALEAVVPNFTEIEIDSVAKQVAAGGSVFGMGTDMTIYSFSAADYRSAKFLVKLAKASHTEVSEILLTLDTSDNVAITEYAIVGTNGSIGTLSAYHEPVGNDVHLTLNVADGSATVTVVGTLLS